MEIIQYNERGYRPSNGTIFTSETDEGFLLGGVINNKAMLSVAKLLHIYKAFPESPSDTQFDSVIEENDLLIPPIYILGTVFGVDGIFSPAPNRKKRPRATPLETYYRYQSANKYSHRMKAFYPKNADLDAEDPAETDYCRLQKREAFDEFVTDVEDPDWDNIEWLSPGMTINLDDLNDALTQAVRDLKK